MRKLILLIILSLCYNGRAASVSTLGLIQGDGSGISNVNALTLSGDVTNTTGLAVATNLFTTVFGGATFNQTTVTSYFGGLNGLASATTAENARTNYSTRIKRGMIFKDFAWAMNTNIQAGTTITLGFLSNGIPVDLAAKMVGSGGSRFADTNISFRALSNDLVGIYVFSTVGTGSRLWSWTFLQATQD